MSDRHELLALRSALDAATREAEQHATKVAALRSRLERAWEHADQQADELDSIYAHIRAVAENCKTTDVAAIRHQLVGLLPECQGLDPERERLMRERGMGHLVEQRQADVRAAWASYGYPPTGEDNDERGDRR